MEFQDFHKFYFNATRGAYSKVTEREFFDSQITFTDSEAEIVLSYFGYENIHIGNVQSDRIKAQKQFLLYNENRVIHLNVVFPKPEKSELRLYISINAGFKPVAGSIWFLFESNVGELVIGAMNELDWFSIGQFDAEDSDYQSQVEEELVDEDVSTGNIKLVKRKESVIVLRDPRIAVLRLKQADYNCEVSSEHRTFISQRTQKPFMEAHHLIPIQFQPLFNTSLDTLNNVFSLCPNCHRAIHHAEAKHKLGLITTLFSKRRELHDFEVEYIAQFYNCTALEDNKRI